TTDLRTKIVEEEITIKNKTYRIFGVAKGSGMIHPNMATMLAYILTDAPIVLPQIQKLTHYIAERSFNRISVDRDTSTNDSFFLISSNKTDQLTKADFTKIKKALVNTGISLAKQIAVDGEGANHLIECVVKGAKNKKIADVVSREVISSNLVKTAVHGKDPNWGRILMAIGNGLAETKGLNDTPTVSISIQGVMVLTMNEPRNFNEVELSNKMSEKTVYIEIDLHQGTQKATSWGCDLSREYIAINAEYST
ncbi:MAG: bifunctional ornithine acetyltransferase/N-acetylglutamate synthase, partial [Deltaproteobacteria bacterium]|nr:bifunctional ornithine acetyltransferase/N-acetylglutamate synthase [Deltaproteobacteria bacterium]